jgi:putative transposase
VLGVQRFRGGSPEDDTLAHTYSANLFHIVFATKHREDAIRAPIALWAYTPGIARSIGADPLSIGGTCNHVHLLLRLPPQFSIAEATQKIKSNSSRWLRDAGRWEGWQEGYGSFSVGVSSRGAVCRYIRNQAQHHAKHTFEDEFVSLLIRGGIEFDRSQLFV